MSSLVRFFTGRKAPADLTEELLRELQPYFPNCGQLLPPPTPSSAAATAAAGTAAAGTAASGGGAVAGTPMHGGAAKPADAKSPAAAGAAAKPVEGKTVPPSTPHASATVTAAGSGGSGEVLPPTVGANGKEIDDKTLRAMTATLGEIKVMLYGDGETETKPENIKKILDDLMANELLMVILNQMRRLEFEARKDVTAIYTFALKNRKDEMIAYFQRHPQIMSILVNGYHNGDVALQCGLILRDALRHDVLLSGLLAQLPLVEQFFAFVQLPTFDVASDAFATFKTLLTKHKTVCAHFIESNFDWFFTRFNGLLESANYVVKRQSLKLLGELLMSRNYYGVMIRYVTSAEYLKCILGVLKSNTKAVQIEAFHVFKIFIANPSKSPGVTKILLTNRDKLAKFIGEFTYEQADAAAAQNFAEEKGILLQSLAALQPMAATTPTAAASPVAAAPAAAATAAAPTATAAPAAAKPPAGK